VSEQRLIAIVGAGQAGIQIAESLRQEGHQGSVLLIGEEPHPPYQRPPLSKKWLIESGNPLSLALRGRDALTRRQIELRLESCVRLIDRAAQTLCLSSGESLRYDRLALATGSRPRLLQLPGADLAGVHYLRGVADSSAIAAALRRCAAGGERVIIIGGGFIGLEVAAGARKLGAAVMVIEALPRLMSRVTAPIVSDTFERVHRSHSVEFMFNTEVSELVGSSGAVNAVRTANGNELAAGCVIVGIGAIPEDRLAAAAGLECDRGVIVDACSRTSDPGIAAAGDCTARRLDDGRLLRLESVHNAVEQGKSAAAALMGRERPFCATPWFWSDQYDVKLQMAGLSHGYDQVIVRGDVQKPAFSAYYFQRDRLIAVDSLSRIPDHMLAKRLLDHELSPSPAQVADPQFDLQSLLKQTA
jgi:3-phenylpropionate/trans-cinnamate dioxygenase ferredoxin reductase subunit